MQVTKCKLRYLKHAHLSSYIELCLAPQIFHTSVMFNSDNLSFCIYEGFKCGVPTATTSGEL